jgi:hypothetical protein
MSSLEEAAIQSAKNMGIPEQFGCHDCGGWFKSTVSYLDHFPCLVEEDAHS